MIGEINRQLKSKIVQEYGNQKQFARENDISEGIVSRVIRGRFNLTAEEREQWASALGATASELFSE